MDGSAERGLVSIRRQLNYFENCISWFLWLSCGFTPNDCFSGFQSGAPKNILNCQKYVRSGKLQNESFPNFSRFCPEFCPEFCSEFSPNFSRTFRASFRGRRRDQKISAIFQWQANARKEKYSQNSSGEQLNCQKYVQK